MADQPDKSSVGTLCKNFFCFHYRGLLLILIPIALCPIVIFWPQDEGRTAYIFLILIAYSVSNFIPLWVTGLFAPVVLPCMGLMSSEDVSLHYFSDPVCYMFGSYMMAIAFESCGLHKRLAYQVLRCSGYGLFKTHMLITLVTFILSTFFCNTATVALMCPVVKLILEEFETQKITTMEEEQNAEEQAEGKKRLTPIGKAFYIAVAYTASAAGSGTVQSSATNYATLYFVKDTYNHPGNSQKFTSWMYYAWSIFPSVLIVITIFFVLEFLYFGFLRSGSPISQQFAANIANKGNAITNLNEKSSELGKWDFRQILVTVLFILLLLSEFIISHNLLDIKARLYIATAIYFIVILMFMLPIDTSCCQHFSGSGPYPDRSIKSLLSWVSVRKIFPWGLMFMMGSMLACSEAVNRKGLAASFENQLPLSDETNVFVVQLLIILITMAFTMTVANVACAHLVLPTWGNIAMKCKIRPLYLLVPAGTACNFSFLFPCGTPANVVVDAYANIGTLFFIISGIIPTLFSIIILMFAGQVWFRLIFGDPVD